MADIYQSQVIPKGVSQISVKTAQVQNPFAEAQKFAAAIGDVVADNNKDIQRLNLSAFENDVKLKTAEFEQKLQNEDIEDYNKSINEFNQAIDTLGKSKLGGPAYSHWQDTTGNNYKELAKISFDGIYAKKQIGVKQKQLTDIVDQQVNIATLQPKNEAVTRKITFAQIDNAGIPEEQKEVLKQRFENELSKASAVRDIRINPETAMTNLSNPEMYKSLDPVQRQNLISSAKRLYEAEKNTAKDKRLNGLISSFNNYYTTSPSTAYNFFTSVNNNKAEIMKQYGLDEDQFKKFRTYANNILTDKNTAYAINNENLFAEAQTNYKLFEIDKSFKIKNKDLDSVESVVDMISNIDRGISDGTYYQNQKDAIEMRAKLQSALGVMMEKKPKLQYKNIFSDTVSESLSDSINEILKNKQNVKLYKTNELTANEKGIIYEHVYKTAIANNLDLKSNNIVDKEQIKKITDGVFNWFVQNKYRTPDKKYSAVVGGQTSLFDLPEGDNTIGVKQRGYSNYELDVNGRIVLKDENGDIIDEVNND